jgi:hypothetical protein
MANETERAHWKSFMDKNFIGSWSLPDGKDIILTIATCEMKEAWNEKMQKKVPKFSLTFAEKLKGLDKAFILNTTNGEMIEKVAGSCIPEDWIGKKLQIGSSNVRVGGKTMPALRVRDVSSEKIEQDIRTVWESIPTMASKEQINAMIAQYDPICRIPQIRAKITEQWQKLTAPTSTPE